MATTKLSGKELRKLGYPEGRVIGTAMKALEQHYKGKSKKHKLELLERVIREPALYAQHETLGPIAKSLLIKEESRETKALNEKRIDYTIYGEEEIEPGAINQMEIAMKLPVTVAGALMPDAHQGYGLPIGGVLATNNAVIPYAVGVDIGCRMAMSLYDISTNVLTNDNAALTKILQENTKFGFDAFRKPFDDAVLSRAEFNEINILKTLKDRAAEQIGTSGGGNHFVEFGIGDILSAENEWNLPPGKYLAVLSHSGSRGLGANIARHYTKLAMDKCRLPGEARHLAWLDLDTEEGQEYWLAMNLAGDYASANHNHIHRRISAALGEIPLAVIENHHNFAWKEKDINGNEVIVHRKGATPAGEGVTGIIPGSMSSPGFIVKGKGNISSLNSASHGAGRVMSRTKAKQLLSQKDVNNHLKEAGITLLGSGLDEAPMVYKDIHQVMAAQTELVEVLGSFTPKIVRMCGNAKFGEVD